MRNRILQRLEDKKRMYQLAGFQSQTGNVGQVPDINTDPSIMENVISTIQQDRISALSDSEIGSEEPQLQQTGGMYNQMRQYQGGGVDEDRGWKSYYPEKDDNKDEKSNECYIDENGKKICLAQDFKSEEEARKYIKRFPPTSQEELDKMKQTGGMYDQMRQYQQGGMVLPGGEMEQIPGSDAVQFNGQTHDQGGIMMDPQTEVEDGETMDQVTMASKGGKRKDYFFSSHLKEGGRSFADMHKDILANGGRQEDIDYLAKMQEKKAGRNENQVAKLGGVVKYQNGTFAAYGTDYDKIEAAYTAQGLKGRGKEGSYRAADLGDADISDTQRGTGSGYYGEASKDNLEDFYSRNTELLNSMGINSASEFDPKKHTKDFQTNYNKSLEDRWDNDPAFKAHMEENGLTRQGYIDNAGFSGSGSKGLDGLYGEYTYSRTGIDSGDDPGDKPGDDPGTDDSTTVITEEEIFEENNRKTQEKQGKDYTGALIGLAGMIPAVMAYNDAPDYMSGPDLSVPGIVKAERVAKQHLDRVDFNDQLARNSADATAVNRAIDTSGGGPASIANKMAMYAKKQQGDREIQAQEERANIAISNEEATMDNKRKVYNAEAALDASKFNVGSEERASKVNTRNKMYVDEFNRGADAATSDRKLNAVQYGINTLATLHRDNLTYKASQDYADAIDGQRGTLDRRYNTNSSNKSSSSSYNKTKTTTNADGTVTIVKYDKEGNVIPNAPPVKEQRGGYRQLNLMRNYGK